ALPHRPSQARPRPRPKHLHPRGHPDHRLPARRPPLRRLALPRRHVSTPPRPPPRPDRHPRHLGSPTRRRRPRRPRRTSAERLSPYHQCGYRQRLGPAAAQRTRPQPHLRTQVALRDRRRPHRLGRGSDPPRRLLDRQHLHLRHRRRLAALRLQIARRLRHQPHPPLRRLQRRPPREIRCVALRLGGRPRRGPRPHPRRQHLPRQSLDRQKALRGRPRRRRRPRHPPLATHLRPSPPHQGIRRPVRRTSLRLPQPQLLLLRPRERLPRERRRPRRPLKNRRHRRRSQNATALPYFYFDAAKFSFGPSFIFKRTVPALTTPRSQN